MKRTILVIIFLAILAVIMLYWANRTVKDYNDEIEGLKRNIELMKIKADSLESQIMARHDLIERQNKNIQELSTKNRKLQIDYEKRIKAVNNLNAAGQLDLFTELVNN
jgi:predicted RNase H-like nuclease (RuvC/YqgF family)